MKSNASLVRSEMNLAKRRWIGVSAGELSNLRKLLHRYRLSVALGDVLCIDAKWYVTHSGLLRLAHRRRCLGIKTFLERRCSEPSARRWIFKAIVFSSPVSKGFVGYGDADPSNVSSLVRGAEMRIAETRAVNRALRKAYGIGLCSVEELGWTPRQPEPETAGPVASVNGNNGHDNRQPRLRDRLCLLIRQHHLDAALVKAYAADYCGTSTLSSASRESVEAFINHLAEVAARDRDGLLCRLNSYAKTGEAQS